MGWCSFCAGAGSCSVFVLVLVFVLGRASAVASATCASAERSAERDERSDADFYELIGDDDGVFGCMSLLGCHDLCPKQLPLQTQIAFLRRKMAALGLS